MVEGPIYFVSSNEEKYREIRGALAGCGVPIERVNLDLPEIQSIDPAEVAAYKAQRAFDELGGGRVLVEDTGLAIDEWNGYPGALIKWVLGAIGEEGLCRQLDAWENRAATATVVLCLHDGTTVHTFRGRVHGQIAMSPRGDYGFGWDNIFMPEGSPLTYGQIPREEKMRDSMRARALAALVAHLKQT